MVDLKYYRTYPVLVQHKHKGDALSKADVEALVLRLRRDRREDLKYNRTYPVLVQHSRRRAKFKADELTRIRKVDVQQNGSVSSAAAIRE
jgi:hypothetical protein